jgi:thiamine kinase-like enzyme
LCPDDHLKNLNFKVEKLLNFNSNNMLFLKYKLFVNKNLIQFYTKAKNNFLKKIPKNLLFKKLSKKDLIISPSDFGFHNIIKTKNEYFFIDFEYSGLDDPLKLICDFVCNPEYNLNKDQISFFINQFILENSNINFNKSLIKIYLPIYRLKWICIILNDFTQEKIDDINYYQILNKQLIKAIEYYKRYCS